MSARIRTTRLSSGSTSKRNYAEGLTSSDEDDQRTDRKKAGARKKARSSMSEDDDNDDSDSEDAYVQPKKEKSNGNGRSMSGSGSKKAKSKVYISEDDASSDEFVDEEQDDSDDEGDLQGEESDEEDEYENSRGKPKAARARKSSSSVKSTPSKQQYGTNEVIQLIRAPKEKVPTNRISEHTLAFMRDMQDPQKNDRDWFAAHKDVYDYINANWQAFTAACVDAMIDDADDTIAWMQPKDLVERIYRDVRFSNDKTPYKRHLSWCMGRTGLYEVSKDHLEAVRQHLLQGTAPGNALRQLVQRADFVKAFGAMPKSTKSATGKRTSLWGSDDELKRAPKGHDPDHPDALWLRLKSYTVSHYFTDAEVLQPDIMNKIIDVARIAQPLVELMNEITHGPVPNGPTAA